MNMQMEGEFITSVVLTGLSVVFLALIFLIFFVWLMGVIFTAIKNSKSKPKKVAESTESKTVKTESPVVAQKIEKGISGEVIAAISAAVACFSDGNYVIKSVKKASSKKSSRRSSWGNKGIVDSTKSF